MASILRADLADASMRRRDRMAAAAAPYAALAEGLDTDDARSLTMLIEGEIIPRLVVAHAAPPSPRPAPDDCCTVVTRDDVETLAALALEVEADDLIGHIEAVIARGAGVDTVLVELLAPTARLLGEYWESDERDFLDVTMALWRLQEAVHELATRVPADRPPAAARHRALFASMPGDQHSFGTVVIDELFCREGWLTDRMCEADTHELLRCASREWFDLIGLTVSCDCHIARLASIIVGLRNVSRNPHVCVMVGGRVFNADPGLAAEVGADGTARDARLALTFATELVREREAQACS